MNLPFLFMNRHHLVKKNVCTIMLLVLTVFMLPVYTSASPGFESLMNEYTSNPGGVLNRLFDQGRFILVDSLFTDIDKKRKLSSHEKLKWGEALLLIGRKGRVAELFCSLADDNLEYAMKNVFANTLSFQPENPLYKDILGEHG